MLMRVITPTTLLRLAVGFCLTFLLLWMPAPTQADFQTDPTCVLQINAWQPAPPLPDTGYHLEGGSVLVGDNLFLLSGYDDGTPFLVGDRVDVFNFTTNAWVTGFDPANPAVPTPYDTMPVGTTHVQAATDGRYIYMAGGFPLVNGSAPVDTFWIYDPQTRVWTNGAPLPQPRGSGALAYNSVTNQLHYISGLPADRSTDQPDHWTLDLSNPAAVWVARANIPIARNHFQAVEIDGKMYAVGGQQGHDAVHADTRFVHVYDPVTDTWTQLADMPISRSHHEGAMFVFNERIVIIAGSASLEGQDQVANVTTYNPQTGTWTELTPIPVPLYGASAATYNGRVFVTGGGLTNPDLQLNSWSTTFAEDCAPTTPATAPNAANTTVAQASPIGIFDPAISKIGFLTPGQLGAQNEQLEWMITVSNNGTANGQNIVISDTLRPELRIDNVTTSQGTVSINGQDVTVTIPTLAPNASVQISIFTTVIAGGAVLDNVACLSADNSAEICATGQAISTLPATGETPLETLLFQLVAGMLLVLGGLVLVFKSIAEMIDKRHVPKG